MGTRPFTHDEAAEIMRRVNLEPQEPYPGSKQPWRCLCLTCNRPVVSKLRTARNGSGCWDCGMAKMARSKRLDGDTAAEFMRAQGLEPQEPYPGSCAPWTCRCIRCGKLVRTYHANVRRGKGCWHCGQERIAAANVARTRRDDASAEQIMRDAGFEPLEPYPGCQRPWRARCVTCQQVRRPLFSIVLRGSRCRMCWAASQRIPESEAVESMRAVGFEPLEPFPGSTEPWRCRHEACGHEVSPRLNNIRSARGGTGCAHCGMMALWTSRVIGPDDAAAMMRERGLEPQEPYPGRNREPWRCVCVTCGTAVRPTLGNVLAGHGCRVCCGRGFDPSQPGRCYVLAHRGMAAAKVGITTAAHDDRLDLFRAHGWEVVRLAHYANGADAEAEERRILALWRSEGFADVLGPEDMPNGWTETAPIAALDLLGLELPAVV